MTSGSGFTAYGVVFRVFALSPLGCLAFQGWAQPFLGFWGSSLGLRTNQGKSGA